MADWVAGSGLPVNGHSRNSSISSGRSRDDFDASGSRTKHRGSVDSSTSSSEPSLLLSDGNKLSEESITEIRHNGTNGVTTNGSAPSLPPKDPIRMKKPAPSVPSIVTSSAVDTIPEEDITIPNDGCLYTFTADEMATFFRYMRIDDRYVNHWQRKGLDGKKFSRLSNSELESCGQNNPLIRFFRDKSVKKTSKGRMNFLL